MLKPFYFDMSSRIGDSKGMFVLLGLDLMRMLTVNSFAEFHANLELLSGCLDNAFIQFPIQIEQSLMEGSYHKVSGLRKLAPSNEYVFFLDILLTTIRSEIASCMEKAYCSIPLSQIPTILLAKNEQEVLNCVNTRNWSIVQNQVYFSACRQAKSNLSVDEVTHNVLHYASEMEKIV